MKVLFAHNALTSYKPKGLVSKCGNWLAKCQKLRVPELLDKGVRGFDLRFRVTKKNEVIVSHGICDYNVNIEDILKMLNKQDGIYVRFINEDTMKESIESKFIEKAFYYMNTYTNIKYKCYTSKKNWGNVMKNDFGEKETELIWTKDKGCNTPERYAKKHNPEFKKLVEEAERGFFYMDFID